MGTEPKQFRLLGDRTVLEHTVSRFQNHPGIGEIIIAAPAGQVAELRTNLRRAGMTKVSAVVPGGDTRQASVSAALGAVGSGCRLVLVHDAVRPFVSHTEIDAVIEAADSCGAASMAVPVADTLRTEEGGFFGATTPRENLLRMQTPQAFRTEILREAHRAARQLSRRATDDVELVQAAGYAVRVVRGFEKNFKITNPGDWEVAVSLLAPSSIDPGKMTTRVGFGYDVHRFAEGRPLILGGVTVQFEKGLEGHSDADVVLHAIADGLLGAAAMDDIGTHFPDTDARFKGADSRALLRAVVVLVRSAGFEIRNVDVTVALQRPKIRTYIRAMRAATAECLDLAESAVSIKATTTERLGFEGREEGVAAYAVCLLGGPGFADEHRVPAPEL